MDWHKIIWIEPYRLIDLVARMRNENAAWREFKTCLLAFPLNFLAIWLIFCLLARYNPELTPMRPVSALAFSVECGFTLACLYQLHWLGPVMVTLGKERVAAIGWWNRRQWRYDEIACVHFDTIQKQSRTFRVMRLALCDGREIAFGLSNKVNEARIAGVLADQGVEVAEQDRDPVA